MDHCVVSIEASSSTPASANVRRPECLSTGTMASHQNGDSHSIQRNATLLPP
jgi:hypothetical protein